MALAKNGEGHRQGLQTRKRSLGEVERAASSGETATTTFEPMARIGYMIRFTTVATFYLELELK